MMTLNAGENASEHPSEPVKGYCMKCNETLPIIDAEYCETKQKTGVRGRCGVCGKGMFKFIGSKTRNRPPGYYDQRKREARLEKRRQKLLDGVPPIRAAYISDQIDPKPEPGSG